MKKIYKVIIGVIAIFILINLVWYISVQARYKSYTKAVPKNNIGVYYAKDNEGYHYNVKKPNYLTTMGNLAVTDVQDNYSIIIWPSITSENKFKVGAIINKGDKSYNININEKLEVQDKSPELRKVVEENKPELQKLINKANTKWHLY